MALSEQEKKDLKDVAVDAYKAIQAEKDNDFYVRMERASQQGRIQGLSESQKLQISVQMSIIEERKKDYQEAREKALQGDNAGAMKSLELFLRNGVTFGGSSNIDAATRFDSYDIKSIAEDSTFDSMRGHIEEFYRTVESSILERQRKYREENFKKDRRKKKEQIIAGFLLGLSIIFFLIALPLTPGGRIAGVVGTIIMIIIYITPFIIIFISGKGLVIILSIILSTFYAYNLIAGDFTAYPSLGLVLITSAMVVCNLISCILAIIFHRE